MCNEAVLNCKQLAESIGRSPGYISAAKAAGYVLAYARLTTRSHFLRWLAANPEFVTTDYTIKHSKAVRERARRRGQSYSQRSRGATRAWTLRREEEARRLLT
jgi:hypothetical protein